LNSEEYTLFCQDWAERKTIYTYDNMNRLTEILRPNGCKRKLAYDSLGNKTQKIGIFLK